MITKFIWPYSYLLLLIVSISCNKEKGEKKTNIDNGPMQQSNGWVVEKKVDEYRILVTLTSRIDLQLVKQHNDGIQVLYESIYNDASNSNVLAMRWRAFNNEPHKVEKVYINNFIIKNGLVINTTNLINAYSKDLTENGLFAIVEEENQLSSGSTYSYDYFNAKAAIKTNIKELTFNFLSTQKPIGVGSANPKFPFIANGLNARILNNNLNIFNASTRDMTLAAAPKGDQLVMFNVLGSKIYINESSRKTINHSSGSTAETAHSIITKNIFDFSKFTGTSEGNDVITYHSYFDENSLYVFLTLSNGKHRYFELNLNNYTLKTLNGSNFENIDFQNNHIILMSEGEPGNMIFISKAGILHYKNGVKVSIPTPMIDEGTNISNWYYSDGKIWQLLFSPYTCYLISKKI